MDSSESDNSYFHCCISVIMRLHTHTPPSHQNGSASLSTFLEGIYHPTYTKWHQRASPSCVSNIPVISVAKTCTIITVLYRVLTPHGRYHQSLGIIETASRISVSELAPPLGVTPACGSTSVPLKLCWCPRILYPITLSKCTSSLLVFMVRVFAVFDDLIVADSETSQGLCHSLCGMGQTGSAQRRYLAYPYTIT